MKNTYEIIAMRELTDAGMIIAARGDGLDATRIMGWASDPREHRTAITIRSWMAMPESFRFKNAAGALKELRN